MARYRCSVLAFLLPLCLIPCALARSIGDSGDGPPTFKLHTILPLDHGTDLNLGNNIAIGAGTAGTPFAANLPTVTIPFATDFAKDAQAYFDQYALKPIHVEGIFTRTESKGTPLADAKAALNQNGDVAQSFAGGLKNPAAIAETLLETRGGFSEAISDIDEGSDGGPAVGVAGAMLGNSGGMSLAKATSKTNAAAEASATALKGDNTLAYAHGLGHGATSAFANSVEGGLAQAHAESEGTGLTTSVATGSSAVANSKTLGSAKSEAKANAGPSIAIATGADASSKAVSADGKMAQATSVASSGPASAHASGGEATGQATSLGGGLASATAESTGAGAATAEAVAKDGGPATAQATGLAGGKTIANAQTTIGAASAVAQGKGDETVATSNTKVGLASSLAESSSAGLVKAESKGSTANAQAISKGSGAATSDAVATDGPAKAATISNGGSSIANAVSHNGQAVAEAITNGDGPAISKSISYGGEAFSSSKSQTGGGAISNAVSHNGPAISNAVSMDDSPAIANSVSGVTNMEALNDIFKNLPPFFTNPFNNFPGKVSVPLTAPSVQPVPLPPPTPVPVLQRITTPGGSQTRTDTTLSPVDYPFPSEYDDL